MTQGQRTLLERQAVKDQESARYFRVRALGLRYMGENDGASAYQRESAFKAKLAQRALTLLVTGQILV